MSDLISRSTAMENYCNALCPKLQKGEYCNDCIVKAWLNNQPTAYDIDKVVEELESEKRYGSKYDSYYEENLYRGEMFENDVNNKTIDKAIEIVKHGGVDDDVCEWHEVKGNVFFPFASSCGKDALPDADYKYCPYCRKKIKVVE